MQSQQGRHPQHDPAMMQGVSNRANSAPPAGYVQTGVHGHTQGHFQGQPHPHNAAHNPAYASPAHSQRPIAPDTVTRPGYSDRAVSPGAIQRAAPVTEARTTPVKAERSTGRFNRLSDSVGGSSGLKNLVYAVSAFFLLFTILAATKFFNDNRKYVAETRNHFGQSLKSIADDASHQIDDQIALIDHSLFSALSPQDITDAIAQSGMMQGVALLNKQGGVLSQSGALGDLVSNVSPQNFPKGDVQINSAIAEDGRVFPLIIRRREQFFLVAALTRGTLLGDNAENAAIIMDGGRVIDSGSNIQTADALTAYNLSPQQLAGLTKSDLPVIQSANSVNGKVWLGTARVPKSYLSVIDIRERGMAPALKESLILFGLLLLGMGWLIWMLFKQLLEQLYTLKNQKNHDEISRQRYEAAVDGSRGGIWEIDLAKNTTYLSPSLAKIFNLPEEHTELPMAQFLGLFSPTDREKLFAAIRRSHISGEFDIELGVAHLPIHMACRGRPSVRGVDNAKIIIGMALNVTEMRGAQTRLQAAEARLFDALKSMTDSFVIWDQMDRLILWNQRFEDFFGFKPGQLQVGIERATVDYHGGQNIAHINEQPEADEIQLNDGRWIRYSESRTADGGCVSIGTEVTAIRTRENELQVNQDALEKTISVLRESQVRIVELAENYEQEKIRAEEASQSKSEFLANMSHELRTPLNAINGFSDIMKKELFGPLGDPRYKEYVNDILFSGQHLLSLINDILDMSKIEAGKMTLNTEMLQINDMISQVIRIVRGRADDNRLKLIFEETEAAEVEADPRAVKQVLLNLITNAIKFTPEGGTVTVSVEPKSAGLIVRVTDTGIGISKEDIDRLAQPFEQIDSQHSRNYEGTGLGLALSKSLVELHGGNFTMESEIGEGTTVIFTLPSSPPVVVEAKPSNEVGNEISRLAKDIADVLVEGEARVGQKRPNATLAPTHGPVINNTPEPAAPKVEPPQEAIAADAPSTTYAPVQASPTMPPPVANPAPPPRLPAAQAPQQQSYSANPYSNNKPAA